MVAYVQRAILGIWGSPLWAALVSLELYLVLAAFFDPHQLGQSSHPYFIYLADAFLNGSLSLVNLPVSVRDLVFYQGNYYLYWPPFPAVLWMPVVALLGRHVSDAPLTLLAGTMNVALVSLLLGKLSTLKIAEVTQEKRAYLTAFFAFGTVHVTLVPHTNVWTTAQVLGFTLVASSYLAALHLAGWRGALIAGLLAGCAFLTRNPSILAMAWVGYYVVDRERRFGWRNAAKAVTAGAIPVLIAVSLFGAYNLARFGAVTDVGLAYHNMATFFTEDYARYGTFSVHYLPTNLFYYLLAFPYLALFSDNPGLYFWMGGSIFLMSPVFFLAFRGIIRSWSHYGWSLAVSCVAGMLPALMLMGTGWVQFGPRYSLDITVPLLVATAIGLQGVPNRLVAVMSALSIAVYLPGAILLGGIIALF